MLPKSKTNKQSMLVALLFLEACPDVMNHDALCNLLKTIADGQIVILHYNVWIYLNLSLVCWNEGWGKVECGGFAIKN